MGCYLRNDWECCWYVVCCLFFVFVPLLSSLDVLYDVHSLLPCSTFTSAQNRFTNGGCHSQHSCSPASLLDKWRFGLSRNIRIIRRTLGRSTLAGGRPCSPLFCDVPWAAFLLSLRMFAAQYIRSLRSLILANQNRRRKC